MAEIEQQKNLLSIEKSIIEDQKVNATNLSDVPSVDKKVFSLEKVSVDSGTLVSSVSPVSDVKSSGSGFERMETTEKISGVNLESSESMKDDADRVNKVAKAKKMEVDKDAVCVYYIAGRCSKDGSCPFKHERPDGYEQPVCKL